MCPYKCKHTKCNLVFISDCLCSQTPWRQKSKIPLEILWSDQFVEPFPCFLMQSSVTMLCIPVNMEMEQGKHFLADFLKILCWPGRDSNSIPRLFKPLPLSALSRISLLTFLVATDWEMQNCASQMPTSLTCNNHYTFKFIYSWVERCQA